MAESFLKGGATVHFSNAGGEDLFCAWITLTERRPPGPARDALLDFLKGQHGTFACSIDFDSSNWRQVDEPVKQLFLSVVADSAREVAKAVPEDLLFGLVCWDDELRARWLPRLLTLHTMVRKTLNTPAAPLTLALEESIPKAKPRLK